jgi:hypothetical protein
MNVIVRDITIPRADAGPDRTVDEDTLVTFDGSGSSDNVGIVNFSWSIIYIDGVITLYGGSVSFTFDVPGIYRVTLAVSDAAGNRAGDATSVTVRDITPPVAVAGPDRTVPAGQPIRVDASASHDNAGVMDYTWTLDVNGTPQTLRGKVQNFTFASDGVHELRLMVSDAAGNVASDTVVLTVVDRGRVTGMVLDQDGNPVEGATVLLTAPNGSRVKVGTGPDGSFGVNPRYGPYYWSISKKGYRTISGNCSVAPMNTTELDLSGTPLVREKEGASTGSSLMILAAIIILVVIGIALVVLMKKKGRSKG